MIDNRRCRRDEFQMVFSFQTLLNNVHMQKAQETAAETKAQSHGRFRLKDQCRIINLHLFERIL